MLCLACLQSAHPSKSMQWTLPASHAADWGAQPQPLSRGSTKWSSRMSTAFAGRVYSLLKNWPERRVKAICLTDGERVGYLGDLGVQAVGVPISKLALYSACAGIPPNMCLPVCIDAGRQSFPLCGGSHSVCRLPGTRCGLMCSVC